MKREWTNRIRFVLDELVPPLIRDSRWFMWPFFVAAYGRFSVADIMDFKVRAYSMTDEQYVDFYSSLANSMSRRRTTDLNEASVAFAIDVVRQSPEALRSALDVGAGNGYLIGRLAAAASFDRIAGTDAVRLTRGAGDFEFHFGVLPRLPFRDKEFDLVTCTHVIEHVIDVDAAVRELLRVARKAIVVVVPRQRYFRYTLDEHLNFFPLIEPLAARFAPHRITTRLLDGDWALSVDLNDA